MKKLDIDERVIKGLESQLLQSPTIIKVLKEWKAGHANSFSEIMAGFPCVMLHLCCSGDKCKVVVMLAVNQTQMKKMVEDICAKLGSDVHLSEKKPRVFCTVWKDMPVHFLCNGAGCSPDRGGEGCAVGASQ